jgi:hypothetical protein
MDDSTYIRERVNCGAFATICRPFEVGRRAQSITAKRMTRLTLQTRHENSVVRLSSRPHAACGVTGIEILYKSPDLPNDVSWQECGQSAIKRTRH